MARSKTKPKTQMMAGYFSKLSLVFAKAGNLLFHAASLIKLFQLSKDLKKNMSSDEIKKVSLVVMYCFFCLIARFASRSCLLRVKLVNFSLLEADEWAGLE